MNKEDILPQKGIDNSQFAPVKPNQSYARKSHIHCFDQFEPACGLPKENHTQCCLCDAPHQDKEALNNSKDTLKTDGKVVLQWQEDWQLEFDEKFHCNCMDCTNSEDGYSIECKSSVIKSFIFSLLHSTREETVRDILEKFEGISYFHSHEAETIIEQYAQSHGITLSTPPKE